MSKPRQTLDGQMEFPAQLVTETVELVKRRHGRPVVLEQPGGVAVTFYCEGAFGRLCCDINYDTPLVRAFVRAVFDAYRDWQVKDAASRRKGNYQAIAALVQPGNDLEAAMLRLGHVVRTNGNSACCLVCGLVYRTRPGQVLPFIRLCRAA